MKAMKNSSCGFYIWSRRLAEKMDAPLGGVSICRLGWLFSLSAGSVGNGEEPASVEVCVVGGDGRMLSSDLPCAAVRASVWRQLRVWDAVARPVTALSRAALHVALEVDTDEVVQLDDGHAVRVRICPELLLERGDRRLRLFTHYRSLLVRLVQRVKVADPAAHKPVACRLGLLLDDPSVDVRQLGVALDDVLVDAFLLADVQRLDGLVDGIQVRIVLVQDNVARLQGVGLEGDFLGVVRIGGNRPALVRPCPPLEVLEDDVELHAWRHGRTIVANRFGRGVGGAVA
jgi:hypothetical protein